MSENQTTVMTRRYTDKAKISNAGNAGAVNTFTARKFSAHILEMEEVNFHFDSAVLLPDFGTSAPEPGTPEQNRITGLGVLYTCYKHAKDNPDQRLLILGHTDRSGSSDYNVVLSQSRADNVLYALLGNREEWVDICVQKEKHKVEDYQQILKWVDLNWKWGCDPGKIDNKQGPDTEKATLAFQKKYNQDFKEERKMLKAKDPSIPDNIPETGIVDRETWGAFFDVYMRELTMIMGTDYAGLQKARDAIKFLADSPTLPNPDPEVLDKKPELPNGGADVKRRRAVGCGENFPITPDRKSNYRNPVDRRVEFLFFDPGEEPSLTCLLPNGPCAGKECELRNKNIYDFKPIPVDPLPERSGIRIIISLKLVYLDPEGKDRDFPKDFPVIVEFTKGDPQTEKVGDDGMLIFGALREKESFTLKFKFDKAHYMAIPPRNAAAGTPDEVIAEDQVKTRCKQEWRVFNLPLEWSLSNTHWSVDSKYYDKNDQHFKPINDISVRMIGSDASPVDVKLDPHWQHLKLLYFDRFLKKKLSILPVMLEGFSKSADTKPATLCNWVIYPQACQCLPWILQNSPKPKNDGTDKPNKDVVIQLHTAENTFIESSTGDSRRLVKLKGAAPPSPSPGIAAEVNTADAEIENKKVEEPNPDRLKYYDLPEKWRSSKYFVKLSSNSGVFGDLADKKTSVTEPFLFSLDDIVLTDQNLNPGTITWKPNDRAAIFSHSFESGTDLSYMGLYKSDTGNNLSYLTKMPQSEKTRNYIADYPDWTRLVVAQGNLFDVFDKRTKTGDVIGARAAVRWVNAPPLGHGAAVTKKPFFIIKPCFEQIHPRTDIGRYDMALLRCCDVKDGKEIAMNFHYIRYYFDFTDGDLPNNLKNNVGEQRKWGDKAAKNISSRWNKKGKYHPGPAEILPEDPGKQLQEDAARKFKFKALLFIQIVDKSKIKPHFDIKIKEKKARSFMNAIGIGEWKRTVNEAEKTGSSKGRFTGAHETGHADSLEDDYVERSKNASYYQPGFGDFYPGAPYSPDEKSMMQSNMEIRTRYYWHIAEWLHSVYNDNYFVKQSKYNYRLPHCAKVPAPATYLSSPLDEKKDQELKQGNAKGFFDLALYPLGKDQYSQGAGNKSALVPDKDVDGILIVLVRMRFKFLETDKFWDIYKCVRKVRQEINRKFNARSNNQRGRWYVKGESKANPKCRFSRCLMYFSPRFLVEDFPGEQNAKETEDYAKSVEVRKPDNLNNPFNYANTKTAYGNKVANIDPGVNHRFAVDVKAAGFFESHSADWSWNTRKLSIKYGWFTGTAELLVREFPRMLGINKNADSVTTADLKRVASIILDNADVGTF